MGISAYSYWLTGPQRNGENNLELGQWLAFVAGAINAGGFFIVGAYTSHMTGLVSSIADNLVLGNFAFAISVFIAILVFFLGAMSCALIVSFLRRRQMNSQYSTPVFFESMLLLILALLDTQEIFHYLLLFPLCFVMGLQNALITKVSGSVVRTTHVTGMITDLGIEIGRLCYWNRSGEKRGMPIKADRAKMFTLISLIGLFFLGGVLGALSFNSYGSLVALPLALVLAMLSFAPICRDFKRCFVSLGD